LCTSANYQKDHDDLEEDLKAFLRNLDTRDEYIERLRLKAQGSYSHVERVSSDESNDEDDKDPSIPSTIQDPIRIAVFNSASYDAHLKANYIINNQQRETEIQSDISNGDERSIFLPNKATNIRIRIDMVSIFRNRHIIDEQIPVFNGTQGKCYVLSGNHLQPSYHSCAGTYSDMLKTWLGRN